MHGDALCTEEIRDVLRVEVGQQDFLVGRQKCERARMKVIGMTVRDPNILGLLDSGSGQLIGRERPVERSTPEIAGPLEPWIGRQLGPILFVEGERSIA